MSKRVATAVVLLALALGVIGATHPAPIGLVALAITSLGVYELAHMFEFKKVLPIVSLAGLALPFYAVYVLHARIFAEILIVCGLLFLVSVIMLGMLAKKEKLNSSIIDLGGLWVSIPMLALLALHDLDRTLAPHAGWLLASPTLLALVPVWAGDTAGYFVGKAFGKHPLSKHSPNKTVEGAIAYFIAAVLGAIGIGYWLRSAFPHSSLLSSPWVAVACGIAAGILGQAGDLFESFLKRRAGVKDSGTLLPGHGGLLDRIDGVLFAAVPIAFIVYFLPLALHHGSSSNSGLEKDIQVNPSSARIIRGN